MEQCSNCTRYGTTPAPIWMWEFDLKTNAENCWNKTSEINDGIPHIYIYIYIYIKRPQNKAIDNRIITYNLNDNTVYYRRRWVQCLSRMNYVRFLDGVHVYEETRSTGKEISTRDDETNPKLAHILLTTMSCRDYIHMHIYIYISVTSEFLTAANVTLFFDVTPRGLVETRMFRRTLPIFS